MVADSGDISFLLVATAMVILMTPGVGLFYGGLVRKKNLISMIGLCFISLAIVTVQWTLFGYTLAFGPDIGGIIGGLDYIGLVGVNGESGSIPDLLFMIFQLSFAAIALAIITSAVAERVKLSAFILFGLLWTTLVYDPLAHWVWGGGWMSMMGIYDFAGGIVVHISAGFGALALALVVGKRRGYNEYVLEPHNIAMTLLGGAILWFGWFGFNGGSALAADQVAINAIVVTNIAACCGALSWMAVSWYMDKPSTLGLISGAIAGLGAITPAAGFVSPLSAVIIGTLSGLLCYGAMIFRIRKNWDESLDAWAIHGVGGTWGTIAIGIFALSAIGGVSGILDGSFVQLFLQVVGVVISIVYAFGMTWVLAKIVNATVGLRVTSQEEYVGLDIAQHGESMEA